MSRISTPKPWMLLVALTLLLALPLAAEPAAATPDPCTSPVGFEALLQSLTSPRLLTPAATVEPTASVGEILAAPPFKLRTCRCSCGFPCSTDADCGAGGLCTSGITCCAVPEAGSSAS